MRYAVYIPNFNDYGAPRRVIEVAVAAEAAGWDGVFVWDHLAFEPDGRLEVADATVLLGALAQATHRIRFGAMITPVARRRPWKLARELVSLDHLSGGRVVCGVGLGEPAALEFAAFGEDPAARTRAARLDEGLAIIAGLTRGAALDHHGEHYRVHAQFAPAALQVPRIPVWVAASLPARGGLRRAARWDGVFPLRVPESAGDPRTAEVDTAVDWRDWWLTPEALGAVVTELAGLRPGLADFDVVASGRDATAATVAAYARAGATWWFDWADEAPGTAAATLERVRRGPPVATCGR